MLVTIVRLCLPSSCSVSDSSTPGAGATRETGIITSVAAIRDLRSDTEKYTVKIDGDIDCVKPLNLTFSQLRDSLPRKEVLAALVVCPPFHRVLPA